jgi:hypothetical protein
MIPHDPRKPHRLLTPAEKCVRFGDRTLGSSRSEYERSLVERFSAGLTLSIHDKREARRLIRSAK